MTEAFVKYTSFVRTLGQFEFLRMPFGLTDVRVFINVFSKLINDNKILLYLDDILATENIEEY